MLLLELHRHCDQNRSCGVCILLRSPLLFSLLRSCPAIAIPSIVAATTALLFALTLHLLLVTVAASPYPPRSLKFKPLTLPRNSWVLGLHPKGCTPGAIFGEPVRGMTLTKPLTLDPIDCYYWLCLLLQ